MNIKYMYKVRAMVIVICLFLMTPGVADASAYADWTGVWKTNLGDVTIKYIPYSGYVGTFGKAGELKGNTADLWGYVLCGTWSDETEAGTFQLKMDSGMKRFKGWRNQEETCWEGTRDIVPEPRD